MNLKKMNKGLDFLREKYGAAKGAITIKDGHCYVISPEGKARAAKRSQEAAQTRRAERVPREQGTGWSLRSLGRVAAKFEQVLRLLRTSSPLAENKFKSCGEQVHFHEGKFPIREERKKDETENT